MKNRFTRRVLPLLIALVFVMVVAASAAHVHSSIKSGDESRCPLCIAAANTNHALASSVVSLDFTPVQDVLCEQCQSFNPGYLSSIAIQDRAPPRI